MKKTILSLLSFILFTYLLYMCFDLSVAYSIGIGVLLLIHELGHVLGFKKIGHKIRGLYFFPFLGAMVIGENKKIENENDYAKVKYFGPFIGFISVLIIFILYQITKQQLLIDLVYIGSVLNLINLIPITLLDGHGILRGSIKYIEWVGFLIAIFCTGFLLKGYAFTALLVMIFFLFSDTPGRKITGFKMWEAIIAILSIISIIIVTIREKEYLSSNLIMLFMGVYIFFVYIKATLFNKKEQEKNVIESLIPLTKKQKALWIAKYLLLSGALLSLFFYSKIYF